MNFKPRISIVTPSFNQGEYIEDTIKSVLEQDYDNIEYMIIDGGSTDDTVNIISKYESRLAYWISEKDAGQGDAIERGLGRATGSIFAWLNSDDTLAPGALSAVAAAFSTNDADLVAGVVNVRQDGRLNYQHRSGCTFGPLQLSQILDLNNEWMTGRFFYQPEVFFTKDIYVRAGGRIDKSLNYSMDFDLWARLAHVKARLKPIDHDIANFRTHAAQKTSSVSAFLPELTRHADYLRKSFDVEDAVVRRPSTVEKRRLRVGMINDYGFKYGAGRAHRRMAECLASAQYEVVVYAFLKHIGDSKAVSFEACVSAMLEAAVDIVIVGNLHGAFPGGADLDLLAAVAPVLVVTHDYFSLTGRCAYPLGCDKYIFSCDKDCPTKHEYPIIASDDIAAAHARKIDNLTSNRVHILANSAYMETVSHRLLAVKMPEADLQEKIRRITLPVPEPAFSLGDRMADRAGLGLEPDDLMVLAISSSVTDRRKGFHHVLEACRLVGSSRIRLFALGWIAPEHKLPDVTYLGSHDDDEVLARFFRAADVMVSATADETFGQTFVEAARCGCPAIGYQIGAVPEVCVPGVSGWLVERNDIRGIATHLSELLGSTQAERNILRNSAHLFATSHFGAPTFLAGINEIFRDLVRKEEIVIPTGVQFGGILSLPIRFAFDADVIFRESFDGVEGPFPEFGIPRRLRWMTNRTGILGLKVPKAGPYLLTLELGQTERAQAISLWRDKQLLVEFDLDAASWSKRRSVAFALDLPVGETMLQLTAEHRVVTPERDLYLAVLDANLTATQSADGFHGLLSDGLDEAGLVASEFMEPFESGHSDVALPGLRLISGFDTPEGPFTELGVRTRLAWLIEPEGCLSVEIEPGAANLLIDVHFPCRQEMVVTVDGTSHTFAPFDATSWDHPTRLFVPLSNDIKQCCNIKISCAHGFLDEAGRDLRFLRLALLGIAAMSTAVSDDSDHSGVRYMMCMPERPPRLRRFARSLQQFLKR